jgi:hypothetical protein
VIYRKISDISAQPTNQEKKLEIGQENEKIQSKMITYRLIEVQTGFGYVYSSFFFF